MNRSGGFFLILLMALGVCAVVYLLLGESLGGGGPDGPAGAGAQQGRGDGMGLSSTGLEASGVRPPTAEELAAQEAARRAGEAPPLNPAEGVFGRVLDGSGAPIANAKVLLHADPTERRMQNGVPDDTPIATAVSGEDGRYVVGPSPPDGYAKVRAEASGYAPTVERVQQRGALVDLILDRGGRLDIRTLDANGDPIADAQVVHSAGAVVTSRHTDADGHALFEAVPTGTGQIMVVKEGFGSVRDTNLAVAPGETEERTLILSPGLEIQGVVTNGETERPEPGVQVSVRYPQLPLLEEGPPVLTDEEGRFKVMAWVGGSDQVLLRARKPEFAEARLWRNAQHKGEALLTLQKAGEAVQGRVVTAGRQPASGVRITYVGMQQEPVDERPEATSDEDGGFTLALPRWAAPGSNFTVIALSDADGMAVGYARVPRKAGDPPKEIELVLGGVGRVAGVVTDKSGAPVQGAVISLAPDWAAMQKRARSNQMPWQLLGALQGGEYHNLTGLSGADGRYEIRGVPSLHYKVHASFGLDSFTLPDAVQVADGEKAQADIALGEGGTIEGLVVDAEDKPIPGAYITASPMQQNRQMGWWQNRATARSQSDGRFVVRGVSDQRYTLTARAAGFGSGSEKNIGRGQKDVVIRMKARGWIVGLVTHEGSPYRGTFTVTARPLQSGGGADAGRQQHVVAGPADPHLQYGRRHLRHQGLQRRRLHRQRHDQRGPDRRAARPGDRRRRTPLRPGATRPLGGRRRHRSGEERRHGRAHRERLGLCRRQGAGGRRSGPPRGARADGPPRPLRDQGPGHRHLHDQRLRRRDPRAEADRPHPRGEAPGQPGAPAPGHRAVPRARCRGRPGPGRALQHPHGQWHLGEPELAGDAQGRVDRRVLRLEQRHEHRGGRRPDALPRAARHPHGVGDEERLPDGYGESADPGRLRPGHAGRADLEAPEVGAPALLEEPMAVRSRVATKPHLRAGRPVSASPQG